MKSAFWRALAVLAIVAMPTLADANDATIGSEAATSAMLGSTLNNTTGLFNAWPHLVVANGNGGEIATSNFSNNTGFGMGRAWGELYDDTWLIFNIGRRDLGTQGANFLWGGPQGSGLLTSSFGNQLGSLDAVTNPWVNFGIAKPLGGGAAWAANVFFNSEATKDAANDPEFTDSATGFGGQFSYGNGEGLHASVELAVGSETDEPATAGAPTLEGSVLTFAANGRYDTDLYIYQASVIYASGTVQAPDGSGGTVDGDSSAFGVLANAGRFLKNEVDGQTSIEFVFAFASGDAGDTFSTSTIVAPGVRVAGWEKISDRFGVMGGFQGVYSINGEEDTNDAAPIDMSMRGFEYTWELGGFFQATENVRFDAKFNPAWLDEVLTLGTNTPSIAYIGATVGL